MRRRESSNKYLYAHNNINEVLSSQAILPAQHSRQRDYGVASKANKFESMIGFVENIIFSILLAPAELEPNI